MVNGLGPIELLRDRIRLAFALLGPIILALTFGYGISFDVEDFRFAVLDRDQSADTRQLIDEFAASPYFQLQPPAHSNDEAERRMQTGELNMLITCHPLSDAMCLQDGSQKSGCFWTVASRFAQRRRRATCRVF